MKDQCITPAETLQIQELLTFKNLCLTKSVTMSPLLSDSDLESILKHEVITTEQHIKELRELLEQSSVSLPELVTS